MHLCIGTYIFNRHCIISRFAFTPVIVQCLLYIPVFSITGLTVIAAADEPYDTFWSRCFVVWYCYRNTYFWQSFLHPNTWTSSSGGSGSSDDFHTQVPLDNGKWWECLKFWHLLHCFSSLFVQPFYSKVQSVHMICVFTLFHCTYGYKRWFQKIKVTINLIR